MLKRKKQNQEMDIVPVKDTLVIVGNGFDIWQGLYTSYHEFEKYYYEHLDEILKKLRMKKHTAYGEDGKSITFSDAELFYGDPFDPDAKLPYEFWHRFEASLDKLDSQRLNWYFGKEKRDLVHMRRSSRNARRILRQAFCDWIETIRTDDKDAGYQFGDNCLFINFNYTDTLIKYFHIDERNEYHIHGEATDPESIIFGHASHPEYPHPSLYQMGGRYRGLYFIEEVRYETDKHVEDNYSDLCRFFIVRGVRIEDIKNIYVLGHSFGEADIGYFRHIVNATQGMSEDLEADLSEEEKAYLDQMDLMEEIHMNMQYAMHSDYRTMGVIPDVYPPILEGDAESEKQLRLEAAVVRRRFWEEQWERDMEKDKVFFKLLKRSLKKNRERNGQRSLSEHMNDDQLRSQTKHSSPQWHISYYSKEDRCRIEEAMKKIKCENFKLYPTIDECLASFRMLS